jgi:hypothetical protein
MKTWKTIIVCILVSIAAFGLTLVSLACILNRHESYGQGDSHSSDLPYVQGVTKSNGYYNISLAFSKVADPIRLDNILVNPHSEEPIKDLTFYLNGTAVNVEDPARYSLKSGDSLQVNLTLPCTEFAAGSAVYLCVMGDSIGCGLEVVLP